MCEKIAIVRSLEKTVCYLFSVLLCAVIKLGLDSIIGDEAISHVFIRSLIAFVLTFIIRKNYTKSVPPDSHKTTIEENDEEDSKNTNGRLRIISPRSRR